MGLCEDGALRGKAQALRAAHTMPLRPGERRQSRLREALPGREPSRTQHPRCCAASDDRRCSSARHDIPVPHLFSSTAGRSASASSPVLSPLSAAATAAAVSDPAPRGPAVASALALASARMSAACWRALLSCGGRPKEGGLGAGRLTHCRVAHRTDLALFTASDAMQPDPLRKLMGPLDPRLTRPALPETQELPDNQMGMPPANPSPHLLFPQIVQFVHPLSLSILHLNKSPCQLSVLPIQLVGAGGGLLRLCPPRLRSGGREKWGEAARVGWEVAGTRGRRSAGARTAPDWAPRPTGGAASAGGCGGSPWACGHVGHGPCGDQGRLCV